MSEKTLLFFKRTPLRRPASTFRHASTPSRALQRPLQDTLRRPSAPLDALQRPFRDTRFHFFSLLDETLSGRPQSASGCARGPDRGGPAIFFKKSLIFLRNALIRIYGRRQAPKLVLAVSRIYEKSSFLRRKDRSVKIRVFSSSRLRNLAADSMGSLPPRGGAGLLSSPGASRKAAKGSRSRLRSCVNEPCTPAWCTCKQAFICYASQEHALLFFSFASRFAPFSCVFLHRSLTYKHRHARFHPNAPMRSDAFPSFRPSDRTATERLKRSYHRRRSRLSNAPLFDALG